MELDISYKSGLGGTSLVTQPITEQAMTWLLENGPLVEGPPLADSTLRSLVRAERIIRLRRNLYLAPFPDGSLMSPEVVASKVCPDGYLGFWSALYALGLTDQEPNEVSWITSRQCAPLKYGQRAITFYASPKLLRNSLLLEKEGVGGAFAVSTASQTFIDILREPRKGPSVSVLAEALYIGIHTKSVRAENLVAMAISVNSPALARRLGFLLEGVLAVREPELLILGRKDNDYTNWSFTEPQKGIKNPTWRLKTTHEIKSLLQGLGQ